MDERFREDAYAYLQHLGIWMVEWREDYARFELPIAPHLGNRHGNPHGGAHASLIDTVMGYAGCWTGAPGVVQHALTLSLNVQYLSRPRGEVMIGEGWRTGGDFLDAVHPRELPQVHLQLGSICDVSPQPNQV